MKSAVAGAMALALSLGLALAQPAAAAQKAQRPAAEKPARAAGLEMLMMEQGNIEVANTADGVRLTVTTDQPKQVARLQDLVRNRIARLEQGAGRAGLPAMVASGELKLGTEDIDSGVAVTVSSTNPQTVSRLQAELPRLVEARKAMQAAAEQARQFDRLLASGKVAVSVKPIDGGVTVSITSDDPRLAAEIKDRLPAYFEGMTQRAQLMKQDTETRGAVNAPAPRRKARAPQNQ